MFMDLSVEEAKIYALLSDELKQSLSAEAFSKMRGEFHKPGTGATESVKLAPGLETLSRVELKKVRDDTSFFCRSLAHSLFPGRQRHLGVSGRAPHHAVGRHHSTTRGEAHLPC
jgi:hypothetical protein